MTVQSVQKAPAAGKAAGNTKTQDTGFGELIAKLGTNTGEDPESASLEGQSAAAVRNSTAAADVEKSGGQKTTAKAKTRDPSQEEAESLTAQALVLTGALTEAQVTAAETAETAAEGTQAKTETAPVRGAETVQDQTDQEVTASLLQDILAAPAESGNAEKTDGSTEQTAESTLQILPEQTEAGDAEKAAARADSTVQVLPGQPAQAEAVNTEQTAESSVQVLSEKTPAGEDETLQSTAVPAEDTGQRMQAAARTPEGQGPKAAEDAGSGKAETGQGSREVRTDSEQTSISAASTLAPAADERASSESTGEGSGRFEDRSDDTKRSDTKETESHVPKERVFASDDTAAGVQNQNPSLFRQESVAPGNEQPVIRQRLITSPQTLASDVENLLEKNQGKLTADQGSMEITLSPASLGKLSIRLTYEAGKASFLITAERPETLHMIARQSGQLGQIISENTGEETLVYTPQETQKETDEQQMDFRQENQNKQDLNEENQERNRRRQQQSESFSYRMRLEML